MSAPPIATRVVSVQDDLPHRRVWAELDNGLQLAVSIEELICIPEFALTRSWPRPMSIMERAGVVLGFGR